MGVARSIRKYSGLMVTDPTRMGSAVERSVTLPLRHPASSSVRARSCHDTKFGSETANPVIESEPFRSQIRTRRSADS